MAGDPTLTIAPAVASIVRPAALTLADVIVSEDVAGLADALREAAEIGSP